MMRMEYPAYELILSTTHTRTHISIQQLIIDFALREKENNFVLNCILHSQG